MAPDDPREALKRAAAHAAVAQVTGGMVLGLGTGSTTFHAVARIGELWQAGQLRDLIGVPTSERTAAQARSYGLPLSDLSRHSSIDLAIDGADEVDARLDLIKGRGGALLREKAVEQRAKRFVVIVDEGKLVDQLGSTGPLPVEVPKTSWKEQAAWLERLGCTASLRGGKTPYVTDNGNYILDLLFAGGVGDARARAQELESCAGILAHGLFVDMADEVIVAGEAGIRVLSRELGS